MVNLRARQITFFTILITLVAALGGFILGFDAGIIIDGKDQISSQFNLTNFNWSLVTCTSIVGSIIAIPLSGQCVDKFGTKNILFFTAAICLIGLFLTTTAHTLAQFIIGRFLVGICVGITSFSCPLFLSEISPPTIRGGMILINSIAITSGQTLSFLAGYFLHDLSSSSWRMISAIEIIPTILFLIGILYMPQSPRWITKKYGIDAARLLLVKIRGVNFVALESELQEIQTNISSTLLTPRFKALFSKKIMPVLAIGIGLGSLQQFVGISTIMYYGPVVFQAIGSTSVKQGLFATFCMGLINCIFTIVSALLVDKMGRRILLLWGTLIAGSSMFLVGNVCLGNFSEKWGVFFIGTYIIGYCISLGSLFWVLISEIFPHYIRGTAMSLVTAVTSTATFLVSLTFLKFFDVLGQANTFFLYGLMSLIAFIFTYFFIPETKGVSLELIETHLKQGKKLRTLGI